MIEFLLILSIVVIDVIFKLFIEEEEEEPKIKD